MSSNNSDNPIAKTLYDYGKHANGLRVMAKVLDDISVYRISILLEIILSLNDDLMGWRD